jgi:hypothetical protein
MSFAGDIFNSHSSVYGDCCFVRCETVYSERKLPTFQWNLPAFIFTVDTEDGDSRA